MIIEIIYKIIDYLPFIDSIVQTQQSPSKKYLIGLLVIFILLLLGLSFIFIIVTLMLRLKNYFKAQKWNKLEQKWQKDLLDILAGDKEFKELINKVDKKQELYFVDYLFQFALRIKGYDLGILSDLVKDYKNVLIKRLEEGDTTQKIRDIITLDKLNIKNLEDKYLQLLNSSTPIVALYAGRALIRQGDPIQKEYLEQISKTLPKYKNWSNRLISNILAQAGAEWAPYFREKLQTFKRLQGVLICKPLTKNKLTNNYMV